MGKVPGANQKGQVGKPKSPPRYSREAGKCTFLWLHYGNVCETRRAGGADLYWLAFRGLADWVRFVGLGAGWLSPILLLAARSGYALFLDGVPLKRDDIKNGSLCIQKRP